MVKEKISFRINTIKENSSENIQEKRKRGRDEQRSSEGWRRERRVRNVEKRKGRNQEEK